MKNLIENIEDINQKAVEMSKNIERIMRINAEILEKEEFDRELYGETKAVEEEINRLEVEIRVGAINAIAMFQPAASDLRFLIGFIEIAKILERIGDLLKGNLKLLKRMSKEGTKYNSKVVSIKSMSEKVHSIFKIYLEAFSNKDIGLLYMIFGMDEEIDEMRRDIIAEVKNGIRKDVDNLDAEIEVFLISYKAERISDKIMSLARALIYIYQGEKPTKSV